MIPSSPKRTWIFLIISSLAFYGPGLIAPSSWDKNTDFMLFTTIYQAAIILAGFWYGPAICTSLVETSITDGAVYQAVQRAMQALHTNTKLAGINKIGVSVFGHDMPFVITAGLLPAQSHLFLSSGLAEQLGEKGMKFLLARGMIHSSWIQRMAALLPILALTVLLPDTPSDLKSWLTLALFLAGWLALHWVLELHADRKASIALGNHASEGLQEVINALASPVSWLSLQPPVNWRLRMARIN